ncbi:MAG: winged helix-turn-helix transcriptional regulator [Phycisphaerae bacterium]|nr:winged helix-turn-helix transcriptional regulator [Phycisphaerae bacterium]
MNLPIENQVVAALRRIIRAIDLQSRRLVEEFGLTGPQLVTLEAAASLGPVSASVLARTVHLSRPTLTGILDRLERRGFISRDRDQRDRRSWSVGVTPAGQEILERTPSLLQNSFRQELAKLEQWEQTLILAMLQRIASMMDVEDLDAAPVLVTGSVEGSGAYYRQPNGDAVEMSAAEEEMNGC